MSDDSLVKHIGDEVGRIFRHMLPGILVVGAAKVSHPSWFYGLSLDEPWHLAVLAAIAVLAGNAWYVLHRFTVHQAIDWIFCRDKMSYAIWLAKHVDKSLRFPVDAADLSEFVRTRSAQIIFLFIMSEVGFAFTFGAANCTFFARHAWPIRIVAFLVFGVAIVQFYLGYTVDLYAVEQHGGKRELPHAARPAENKSSA
jgi:hypothetical protein